MKDVINKYYFYFPLVMVCLCYVFKATSFPIHDFSNYYFGGHLLKDGNFNTAIYFPYEFNKTIFNLGYKEIFASYAPNTPFLAFCFTPFTLFSVFWAKLIFNSISILLFILSLKKLFHHYSIDKKWFVLLPFLFFIPIKNNILFGQVYFLLFYLLTEFWLHYEKGKQIHASLFLSCAILLKVSPAILIFIFVFKKEFKPLIFTFLSSCLLFGISVLVTGTDVWVFWLQNVLSKASSGEIATTYVDNYQSVFMFLKRLFVFHPLENVKPWFSSVYLFGFLNLLFKLFLFAIGYFFLKQKSNMLQFSYWLIITILISPYGSTYTFIIAIFPILILFKSDILFIKKMILFSFLFVAINLPATLILNAEFPFTYVRLFLFLIFVWLFLSCFVKLDFDVKKISFLLVVTIILSLISHKKALKSGDEFKYGLPILIYDFKVENDVLTYFYWNEKGENKCQIKFKNNTVKTLNLINNQVFYKGKQLTFDNGNKKKPLLVDDAIVFLSDYGRGIGFYTLRKIDIQ